MSASRRQFLNRSCGVGTGVAMATLAPQPWLQVLAREAREQDRILVVIQLSGGNDGLNTIVPYKNEAYYRARPKLAIPADSVVKLTDELGLNPALRTLEDLLSADRLSIVQGVGYPEPNRSHFESMDIWHTCQRKTQRAGYGWLGRWLGTQSSADTLGLHLGHEAQPLALVGRDVTVPSIASLAQFRLQLGDRDALKQQIQQLARQPAAQAVRAASPADAGAEALDLLSFVQASSQTAIEASQRLEKATSGSSDRQSGFPKSPFGEKLQIISQLIVSDLPTRVYYVTLDGFDTHAQQPAAHTALLRQWAEGLSAFHARITEAGQSDRVLAVTFSEFGRRVAENASDGTDHGAAAPLFMTGPKLASPLLGKHPSLTDLDDGDLKFQTDFRSVYATLIERWLGGGIDSQPILGGRYDLLPLFA